MPIAISPLSQLDASDAHDMGALPPVLAGAWSFWTDCARRRGAPFAHNVRLDDAPDLTPHMLSAQVLRAEQDFALTSIGDHIRARSCKGVEGARISAIHGRSGESVIFAAYAAAMRTGEPTLLETGYDGPDARCWGTAELYLPLLDDTARVAAIMVAICFREMA